MAVTTSKGVPYPESTDPDKPRTDIQVLAEFIDQIPGVRAGTQAERDVLTDLWPGLLFFNTDRGQLEINRSGTAGDWVWIIDAANPVPVANGGTGLNVAPSMLVNLSSTASDSPLKLQPRPGTTGILPISRGGTGANVTPKLIVALDSTAYDTPYAEFPRPGVTGILPVTRGGTGGNTPATARQSLEVYSKDEIGDPETDFVAIFNAGLTA